MTRGKGDDDGGDDDLYGEVYVCDEKVKVKFFLDKIILEE